MRVSAYVSGLGVLGPGLANWPEAAAVLSGQQEYRPAATVLPMPPILAAAERRRVGRVVKLALGVALQATSQAGEDPAALASVFSSSGADGHTCHELCQALSLAGREISPTRFANSVHNAAAGYWTIATGCREPYCALGGGEYTFATGLFAAALQVCADQTDVLFVAYDIEARAPHQTELAHSRGLLGVGLVLSTSRGPTQTGLQLSISSQATAAVPGENAMSACLPLVAALEGQGEVLTLALGPTSTLEVRLRR
jgi:Beta-ketoacyl synthase, N-terminal domain